MGMGGFFKISIIWGVVNSFFQSCSEWLELMKHENTIYHQKHHIMDRNNLQPHGTLFLSTFRHNSEIKYSKKAFMKKILVDI